MKRILLSFLAAFALLAGTASAQVSIDFGKTGTSPFVSGSTWSAKPSTAANGSLAFVTDVGEGGNYYQYSTALTRWRALNGVATIKDLGAPSANVAASETIVLQALIPAGAWQTNDVLRIYVDLSKSGTTDTGALAIRIGTAGTTADTAVFNLASYMAAATQSSGNIFDLKLLSATSVRRQGYTSTSNGHTYLGNSSNALDAAVTITSAAANALYVSVSIASSGATNTVAMTGGQIQLITP